MCNLASVALPKFVRDASNRSSRKLVGSLAAAGRYFDHEGLASVTAAATRNLNRVIDVTHYPVRDAERSNKRHRPLGIGVQGLADAFILLGLPFDSADAKQLNKEIFETMYYAALRASCDLARQHGPYDTYPGSPISRGLLQHDMWGVAPPSERWDWASLRKDIARWGVRNSLLLAPMPTASTSQILGNNECFEPYTSNIYVRRVLSGEFTVVNTHLLHDLIELGLWTEDMKYGIVACGGSVQAVPGVPDALKCLYRTAWELKQRDLLDMAADRGAFIDQSQSLNMFVANPTFAKLTSAHFHGWRLGLKTGCYYVRTQAVAAPLQGLGLDMQRLQCALRTSADGEACLACGA